MSRGPGVMQREILRRSRTCGWFTVREMATKLYGVDAVNNSKFGGVWRSLQSLVAMGFLRQNDDGRYRRTSKPTSLRREWSTDATPIRITTDEANAMLSGKHYLGAAGYQPTFCLSNGSRDALALFGPPIASHFKTALASPLELTRLWRTDDCGFPLSQFLSGALRWIKREAPETDCVFSYADPAARNPISGAAHHGGVYVASGFALLGPSRVTDYWLTEDGAKVSAAQCYRMFGTKSVARIAELKPSWRVVRGVPKNLYVRPLRLDLDRVIAAVGGRYRELGP